MKANALALMHVCSKRNLAQRLLNASGYDIGWKCDWDFAVGNDHYYDKIHVSGVHHVGSVHYLDHGHLL